MNLEIKAKFRNDVIRLPKSVQQGVKKLIDDIMAATTLREISECRPLKGRDRTYRVRKGDYRIIIELTPEKGIIMMRVLSRGQVYKKK